MKMNGRPLVTKIDSTNIVDDHAKWTILLEIKNAPRARDRLASVAHIADDHVESSVEVDLGALVT